MKSQKTIKLILTAFILLLGLTGCAEKSDRELLQLYDKISVSTAGIVLDGLQFGMTQDEVMQAVGLKDSDIEIKELEDINATVIKVKEKLSKKFADIKKENDRLRKELDLQQKSERNLAENENISKKREEEIQVNCL